MLCALSPALAHGNGRPPATTGVHFRPGDDQSLYVAATFGLLVSHDGCHFYWICENNIGYGGEFDPIYGVSPSGAILATTFHGLRVSRDGGCSFQTATATLPPNDPNNLSMLYLDALAVGPTGDIWVGTAEAGANNHVFRSTDDGVTFAARGALPTTQWIKSIAVAPSDPRRVYVTGFQVSGAAPDGGTLPPSAHLYRSDDAGASWAEQPLVGVALGASPSLLASAVGAGPEVVFVTSQAASPPSGDRLYRTSDGGATLAEVLVTTNPITDVVAIDAQVVLVATQLGGSYRSTDGGKTFAALPHPPQLACLSRRGDGVLFGCGANADPDHAALARSTDPASWQRALQFQYLSGPLGCPAGTVQHDTCDQQLWRGLAQQLGVTAGTCGAGPDGGVDPPAVDAPPSRRAGGCCDAATASPTIALALGVLAVMTRRRRDRRRPST